MTDMPRILVYDIENTPIQVATWGMYQQDALWIEQHSHLLSVAWHWLGEKRTHVIGLPDFEGYEKDPTNDRLLAQHIRDLLDEADVVIGHNVVQFDNKKVRARLLYWELLPPSPHKNIDTLREAKKAGMFPTNKLGDLAEYLGVGEKVPTGGKDLWRQCMEGDPKAWAKMKRYNRMDVVINTGVYYRLLPYMTRTPNLATMADRPNACPRCLSEEGMIIRRYSYTNVGRKTVYQCKGCQGYHTSRKAEILSTQYLNAS